MADKYVVVEYDRDYESKHGVVSVPMSKKDAEEECDYLNRHADPLDAVRYGVEKAS